MSASTLLAGLAAGLFLISCTSTPEPAASPAAAPANAGVAAAAAPSLKETQRLDRELGDTVIPYPFDNCAVIQKPFGNEGPKHRRIYKGYEVLFCCTPCVKAFDANPEPFMPRIIAAAKDQAAGTVTPPVVAGTAR